MPWTLQPNSSPESRALVGKMEEFQTELNLPKKLQTGHCDIEDGDHILLQ